MRWPRSPTLPATALVVLISACKPGEGEEENGESDTTGTTDTTTDTTTGGGEALACEHIIGEGSSDLAWALRCGGPTYESISGAGLDAAGNLLLGFELREIGQGARLALGEFEVEIEVGEASDIVLAKLDPAGEVVWVKQIGGPDNQYPWTVEVCAGGIALAASAPPGTLDLGDGLLADETFIASFDGEGELRWSRSLPALDPSAHVSPRAIACDDAGNLALTGTLRETVDLGAGPIAPLLSLSDGFVARYDQDGALTWAQLFNTESNSSVWGEALAFDGAGDLFLVGSVPGPLDLGAGPVGGIDQSIFVAKFGGEGGTLWSSHFGGGTSYGRALALGPGGEIAVGGIFLYGLEIGGETFENVFPEQEPDIDGTLYDAFLASFSADGQVLWAEQLGTMLSDDVYDLAYRPDASLALDGFGDLAHQVRLFEGPDPIWQWSNADPGNGMLAADADGSLRLAADAYGDVDLGSAVLTSRGETDLLVVRLTPQP